MEIVSAPVTVFRVTVRGRFEALTESQRASLRAAADEHDIFVSSFTIEGCLAYDKSIDFFSFRREVRLTGPASDEAACNSAIGSATEFLRVLGYRHSVLKAQSMNMSVMAQHGKPTRA